VWESCVHEIERARYFESEMNFKCSFSCNELTSILKAIESNLLLAAKTTHVLLHLAKEREKDFSIIIFWFANHDYYWIYNRSSSTRNGNKEWKHSYLSHIRVIIICVFLHLEIFLSFDLQYQLQFASIFHAHSVNVRRLHLTFYRTNQFIFSLALFFSKNR
jgi:hypothetical protein